MKVGPAAGAVDPVCGMQVDPADAEFADWNGQRFHFCCEGCRDEFLKDPAHYRLPVAERPRDASLDTVEHTCPMHPEVRQTGPGSCPLCGMALEPSEISLDLEAGPNPELVDFTRRLRVSAVLTVPLLFGPSPWIQAALATPVVLWAGFPFFVRAWESLKHRSPNMFTLIGVGTGVAYGYSLVATAAPRLFPPEFRGHGGEVAVYHEAAAVIVTLVLLGQVLELKARARTTEALRSLLSLAPKRARRVGADGTEEEVDVRDLVPGDRVRALPGERIAVDGVVVSGSSALDEAMVTGESIPVAKAAGDEVIAGTLNGPGSLVYEARRTGSGTLLAQIVQRVAEAQRTRAPIQRLADRASAFFVPAVFTVALLSALAWWVWGPEPRGVFAVLNAVAVLIIACPCALGLATPMSILVGTGRAAQIGVLFRNAEALEVLQQVDTVVLDKTGTLTEGKPRVVGVEPLGGRDARQLLLWAAALELGSEHPLAEAVLRGARERGLRDAEFAGLEEFRSLPGRGVSGLLEGKRLLLGNEALLQEEGVRLDPAIWSGADGLARGFRERGETVFFLAAEGTLEGLVRITDPIKSTTPEALAGLRQEGLRLVMLTGDHHATAQAVARELGIEELEAGVLPGGKADVIARLKAQGRRVAMAGDGINDAPALAAADVGVAMGGGTDIAIQSAGVVLVGGDLRGLVRAHRLSRNVVRNIRQNLLFAFGYNALGVPIAAGALYPALGWLLSPMIASAAMSLSSVSVIGNALRLRRLRF